MLRLPMTQLRCPVSGVSKPLSISPQGKCAVAWAAPLGSWRDTTRHRAGGRRSSAMRRMCPNTIQCGGSRRTRPDQARGRGRARTTAISGAAVEVRRGRIAIVPFPNLRRASSCHRPPRRYGHPQAPATCVLVPAPPPAVMAGRPARLMRQQWGLRDRPQQTQRCSVRSQRRAAAGARSARLRRRRRTR
jgi:hypothetical protein